MMCVGMFMAILDIQVVATSLPTIQVALQISPQQMSWVQTAYLVAEVIAIPLTGFLTRVLTMRWLFVIAVSIFTFASVGCAASKSFDQLVAWRVVQGFSGGSLIPAVFSAVFLLFPARLEAVATTIAGVLAVLAPTVGPVIGGWITHAFSWHWLFLINVVPGVIAAAAGAVLLPRSQPSWREAKTLDVIALALLAVTLAALEIALKESPRLGWSSPLVLGLFGLSTLAGIVFILRVVRRDQPIVNLKALSDRRFAVACCLSFVLGIGLFGSVYMMPVFLALVRGHDALAIGQIMLVTGLAQLVAAPVAVFLEKRIDARALAAAGFLFFALGLAMSAAQTPATDFEDMFWPQIVRGAAVMFCLLPPTRLALGHLPLEKVPDASGLFNLMRNLGGAIGIALVDTMIFGRAPVHAAIIVDELRRGNIETARATGIPDQAFLAARGAPISDSAEAMVRPLVEKLALSEAINDAWLLIAVMTAVATLCLLFTKRVRRHPIAAGSMPT